jgi:hypothetical protein
VHLRDEFVVGEGFKVEFVFRHRVVPAKRLFARGSTRPSTLLAALELKESAWGAVR